MRISAGLLRAVCVALFSCSAALAAPPESSPWDLTALRKPPAFEWLD